VETFTTVTSVSAADDGYRVSTEQGDWRCSTVVIASGACNLATVPAFAAAVPAGIAMLTPLDYRNPGQLEAGGVLVVGGSATRIQVAGRRHPFCTAAPLELA